MKKDPLGFTLMELMVAMTVVGILSAIVLVSLQGMRERARTARATAQAASVIPSLISCWGNSHNISNSNPTSGGGEICSTYSSYGTWPALPAGYNFSAVSGTINSFSFSVTSSGDGVTICCNSTMKSCGQVTGGCSDNTTWP